MTAAPQSPLADKIAEGLWDSTPTHCDVSWKEATTLFKDDKEWQRSVTEHRKGAVVACHGEELAQALRDLLEDTQHRDHDCGDTPENCPVLAARALLANLDGQP